MSDYRRFVGREVVVQVDEESIHGTLTRDGRDLLELESAGTLSPTGERKPIDGSVLIPVTKVDWVQVP